MEIMLSVFKEVLRSAFSILNDLRGPGLDFIGYRKL
jgi:hypothetical protein